MTLPVNFMCRPYRGVSVQPWDGPLDAGSVEATLVGREAYRRTDFIVLRQGTRTALVRIARAGDEDLFTPIVAVEWVASPDDCAYVVAPEADTANATDMARAALGASPEAAVIVVEGRHHHVNFIARPALTPVRVVEVVQPEPPKLLDMAARVIAFDETLPPVELRLDPIDIHRLAQGAPADRYLLPCRGSGVDLPVPVDFLDERPAPPGGDPTWTLIGCERSRQLHERFYGAEPAARVELCPARLTEARGSGGPTLTKCCLLERGLRHDGDTVVVPWGASLVEVAEALRLLVRAPEA